MSEDLLEIDEMMARINELKKTKALDLSSDQDLSIAIMNLISIEEHFFFTGAKTGNPKYYDLLAEIREMRKTLLKKIIKKYEGEVWCISKHLLAASYRLMEVGTKAQGRNHKEEAEDMFKKSYELYSLFWGLNMGLINVDEVKKIDEEYLNIQNQLNKQTLQNQINKQAINEKNLKNNDPSLAEKAKPEKLAEKNLNIAEASTETKATTPKEKNLGSKLGDIIKKVLNCCIE